jgi:hypothetical protein
MTQEEPRFLAGAFLKLVILVMPHFVRIDMIDNIRKLVMVEHGVKYFLD